MRDNRIKDFRILLLGAALLLPAMLQGCAAQTAGDRNGKYVDSGFVKSAGVSEKPEDLKQSLQFYERLYQRNYKDPEIAIKYAELLRKTGELQRARIVLSTFAQSKKATPEIMVEYANINAILGHFDVAEEFARKAQEKSGGKTVNVKALHILGVALDAQGKHAEAEKSFRAALEKWEGDPAPVMNNLALALAEQGFFDEALDTLHRAYALAPQREEISRNIQLVNQLRSGVLQKPAPKPKSAPKSTKKK